MVQIPGPEAIDRVSPRAGRPVVSGPSVNTGTGLQELGADLEKGSAYLQDAAKQQTTLDGVAADGNASKDLNDLERTFDTRTDYNDFGSSFTDSAREIRDRYAATIADPRARQVWVDSFNRRALGSRSRILDMAVRGQRDERIAGAKSGLEGYQSIIADPNATEDARATARKSASSAIAALQAHGDLTAQEAEAWNNNVIKGGDFVYGQRQIEADPSILTRRTGPTATMIRTAAAKYGADADVAIGIANIESGGNQGASNPKSSATGVFQITSGTAKDYGIDPTDKAQNIDGGVRLTKDNTEALRKVTGTDPTPGSVYLAHFLGLGAAEKIVGADPNAPISNYVNDAAIAANRAILEGKTVGQVRDWAEGKMAKAMGAPLPEWYTSQSPERQLQLERMAQARSNQIETETRGNLQTVIQNAPVAIQNTGTYDGDLPSQDQFVAAYGPQEGAQRYDAFQMATQTARDIFDMKTMPATDIQQMVQEARPTSSGDDAALQQKRYEAISSAAEATRKAREADPVTYVQQSFPNVQQAWNDVSTGGGSLSSAIAATTAAEQRLGIQNVQVLPKNITDNSVKTFKDETQPQDKRIASVASLLAATNDPEQRQAIFNQLVKEGLPEQTQGAFLAWERGDTGAAERLFHAAMVDPSKLPGKAPSTPQEIDQAIQDGLMGDGQIGDIYYGLTGGNVDNFVRAQRDAKLLHNAVDLRVRNGESLEDAVSSAGKDLYGNVQVVDASNAKLLLPADANPGAYQAALDKSMPDIRSMIEDQMALPKDVKASNGQRAVYGAVAANAIDNIMANGYWRNVGDGFGFFNPYTGKMIAGPNGKPFIIHPKIDETAPEIFIPQSVVPSGQPKPGGTGMRDVLMGNPQ